MLTGRIEKAVQHSGKDKIPKALKRQRKKRPKRKDQKGLVGTHMKLQRLLSLTRQALDTYGLIQDGPWMGAWPTAPRFAPGSPCGGKSGSICGKSGGDVWKIRPRKTR